jgi:putative ABC transport system permease protein
MTTARLLRSSLAALRRHRLRSASMMLGSLVGVAALTFVLTIGDAARRKLQGTVAQLFGPSSIVVSGGGGFFMGGPRGEGSRLTLDDAAALADRVEGVLTWDPMQVVPGASVRRGEAQATVRLLGASERAARVWGRGVAHGAPFDAAAVNGSARVALIGETAARELFGDEDPVGGEIRIGTVPFQVTGVLERLGTDIHGMDRDDEIVIPISTAMRRVMNVDTLRAVKLLVRDPERVDAVSSEVRRVLRERHGLADGQPDDFTLMTSAAVGRTVKRVESALFIYLPLVACITLLAGGTVSATLMLSAVTARVGEIGLRCAVGARPRDIRRQFLAETTVTALGGGALGALVGTALAVHGGAHMNVGATVSPGAVALGLGLAAATGWLAGVLPARRAARLAPAVALR